MIDLRRYDTCARCAHLRAGHNRFAAACSTNLNNRCCPCPRFTQKDPA